jgi:hypothetical protein
MIVLTYAGNHVIVRLKSYSGLRTIMTTMSIKLGNKLNKIIVYVLLLTFLIKFIES